MNLFEKLNKLDDSLVESKRVVKKKKLTESTEDDKKKLFNAAASVKCKLDDDTIEYAMYDVDDFIENELTFVGNMLLEEHPEMLFWKYGDDSDNNFGGYFEVYKSDDEYPDAYYQIVHDRLYDITDEVNGDYDYDDDMDKMLTESTEKTTIEVKFEPYTRYGYEPVKTARVSGKDLLDALLNMSDRMRLYVNSDYADDYEEEYGIKLTAEHILDRIASENGDGCDFIYYIKNLTTGETLFKTDYEEEPEDWDDYIDEMLTENRNNPYFAPYGYRDAAKVLNGKAPEYYYHLKEIEMDRGDGVKLAKYALKQGLPVMFEAGSDPDYPTFVIEGEYHWNDYFHPYPSAHEENLIPWDGKMFVEEQLTEDVVEDVSQLDTIANQIVDYTREHSSEMWQYKDVYEYINDLNQRGIWSIPAELGNFKAQDPENITEEEAETFINMLIDETDVNLMLKFL